MNSASLENGSSPANNDSISGLPPSDRNAPYRTRVLAAEISATAQFCDQVIQTATLPHDDGTLLRTIACSVRRQSSEPSELNLNPSDNSRDAILLNGNFNSSDDIQGLLSQIRTRMNRGSRLIAVLYAPWAQWLFRLANRLGLRHGQLPSTFVTETELRALLKLCDLEAVRIRPCLFVPVWIPVLSWLLNSVLPVVPLIRWLALAWIVVARPIVRSSTAPSLSVVIPARNERGNLEAALKRMPNFETTNVEILFVEGHSSDGSWEEIQRLCRVYGDRWKLVALQQTGRGKNDAVRLGFSKATGDILTILDADLTMPPELLPRFYDAWRNGYGDFINGNRLVYPMEAGAMRRLNLLGNRFFAKALSHVLQIPIGDSLCGTKLLSRRDYQRLVEWRTKFGDFDPFGDFELLFAASELALGVVDLPIRYRERTYGTTNISRFRDGWLLLKMTCFGFLRLRLGRTQ